MSYFYRKKKGNHEMRRRKKNKNWYGVVILGFVVASILVGASIIGHTEQKVEAYSLIDNKTGIQGEYKLSEEVGGPDKSDPLLTLVNYDNLLSENWKVDLVSLENGQYIDRRAYDGLKKMIDDARAEGLDPIICSSYRTYDKQTQLYHNQVEAYKNRGYSHKDAAKEAAVWVAVPQTSEHQLGFAVDIVSVSNQNLNRTQEDTPVQKWLMKNCWKYGFILRYPEDKNTITKIGYEPWHYRYVGKQAAKEITDQGICLEEYLN